MADQTFDLGDGRRLVVRAPATGLRFRRVVQPATAEFAAMNVAATPDRWAEAMAAQEMTIDFTVVPDPVAAPVAEAFSVQRSGSNEAHVEFSVPPPAGHTLLVMVQKGDVVQWFLPLNASRLLPVHSGMLRAEDVAAVPDGALRFAIPQSLVATPAPAESWIHS